MKTILITLLALLATGVRAEQPVAQIISVYTGIWLIDFEPTGRAAAYYGPNPGDSGDVDEGTVDFKALLDAVTKAEKKNTKEPGDRFQVSIRYAGQTSTTAYTLIDDLIIQQTLEELDGKWKPHPVGQRFFDLKAKYPIIPKAKEGGGTNTDGSLSKEYCSYCYVNGAFMNPDMTMEEMKALVVEKLQEKGFPKFVAKFFSSGLGRLKRWQ